MLVLLRVTKSATAQDPEGNVTIVGDVEKLDTKVAVAHAFSLPGPPLTSFQAY